MQFNLQKCFIQLQQLLNLMRCAFEELYVAENLTYSHHKQATQASFSSASVSQL